MEQTEELLEKIKSSNSQKAKEILKDIIIIDGVIVQEESVEYKEKVYHEFEEKYNKKLKELKYYVFKENLENKTEKYIESNKKDINTLIGLLKLFLIRFAAIEIVDNNKTNNIIKSISSEKEYRKIKDLYEKLDDVLLKNM